MVLIVAKCIVNKFLECFLTISVLVLIVAKCIVNTIRYIRTSKMHKVLIVAKCIVNNNAFKEVILIATY